MAWRSTVVLVEVCRQAFGPHTARCACPAVRSVHGSIGRAGAPAERTRDRGRVRRPRAAIQHDAMAGPADLRALVPASRAAAPHLHRALDRPARGVTAHPWTGWHRAAVSPRTLRPPPLSGFGHPVRPGG